jgi:hypothetical protein
LQLPDRFVVLFNSTGNKKNRLAAVFILELNWQKEEEEEREKKSLTVN